MQPIQLETTIDLDEAGSALVDEHNKPFTDLTPFSEDDRLEMMPIDIACSYDSFRTHINARGGDTFSC